MKYEATKKPAFHGVAVPCAVFSIVLAIVMGIPRVGEEENDEVERVLVAGTSRNARSARACTRARTRGCGHMKSQREQLDDKHILLARSGPPDNHMLHPQHRQVGFPP